MTAITTPDFGSTLIDALKTDALMVWANWPTWAQDQPSIWVIPAVMAVGIVRAVWPKKRRAR